MQRCDWCGKPGFGKYCTPECAAAKATQEAVDRDFFPEGADPMVNFPQQRKAFSGQVTVSPGLIKKKGGQIIFSSGCGSQTVMVNVK